MKKIVIPVLVLTVLLIYFIFNRFSFFATVDIDGIFFTSNTITNNLSNGIDEESEDLDYLTANMSDIIYQNNNNYYIGEENKQLINLDYPLLAKDGSSIVILTDIGNYVDENFEKTSAYRNTILSNGELYNQVNYERVDDLTYLFLELNNGIYINLLPLKIESSNTIYEIPSNSFIYFSENLLRYYYLKDGKFMYQEITALDYNSMVSIINVDKSMNYEDLLILLGLFTSDNDEENIINEDLEEGAEENVDKNDTTTENNNEIAYIEAEVNLSNIVSNIYSFTGELEIYDPAYRISRNPTFEIKIGDVVYMRKSFASSGTIEFSGLLPNTEYQIVGYYNYYNENDQQVRKTFYEGTITTKDISGVEDLNLTIDSTKAYANYFKLNGLGLTNSATDEVLKGLKTVSIIIDEKEYQLSNSLTNQLADLEKIDYETTKSLQSNTVYNYYFKAYDVAGNELVINNNSYSIKTTKKMPTATIKVVSTDITEATLEFSVQNDDDVALSNMHYIVYNTDNQVVREGTIENEQERITIDNLDAGKVYTMAIYVDYDLEDGNGIVKDYKIAEGRFTTEPLSTLGYVRLNFTELELTSNSAKYQIDLDTKTTNSKLIELVDSFTIEITKKETKELIATYEIKGEDLTKLKAEESYILEILDLTSKTEYDINIITNIELGTESYQLTTLTNCSSFQTLKKDATVDIINKFTTESLIDFDVKINDVDGAILSDRVLLEVRNPQGALVYIQELEINGEYERITIDHLEKEQTYTFTYIAEEYNVGYNNITFEENKVIYEEENITNVGIYGSVELDSLLKQITSKNIFDITNSRRWKSSGNDTDNRTTNLDDNTITFRAKNGYRSYNYYLPEYVGKTLTVSFYAKYEDSEHQEPVYLGNGEGNRSDYQLQNLNATDYTKYTYTFNLSNAGYFSIVIREVANQNNTTGVIIKDLQIEEGSSATEYVEYEEKEDYMATLITTLYDSKDEIPTDDYYLRFYRDGELEDTIQYEMENKTYVENFVSNYEIVSNSNYDISLSVKIRDRFYDIANLSFTSEDEIRTIKTTDDFFKIHTTGIYLVANDLDFSNINQYESDRFEGTIDFQGHSVILNVQNRPNQLINILDSNGVLKNIDLHIYMDNTTAKGDFRGLIYQSYGTISNIKVTLEESSSYANSTVSFICRENYGTIENFVLYSKAPLYGSNQLALGVAYNYGTMRNGYAYGENIEAIYPNYSSNNKRVGAIAGYTGTNSNISNVYSLVGINVPNDDVAGSLDQNVGNIIGEANRTTISNVYSYADGTNRKTTYDANIGVGSTVVHDNLYYAMDNTYVGNYSDKISKLALRNEEFQNNMLNSDSQNFNIEDFVTYGYFPHIIWPDVMPSQDYISLPVVEDDDLIDIISVDSVKQDGETAEVVLTVSNPAGETITNISIRNLDSEIISQETENNETTLTIKVSNPTQYVSRYFIRSITSVSAFNISYTREYDDNERALNIDMYRSVSTVNEFKDIRNKPSENYRLEADLDFTNVSDVHLGSYSGKLDGNNHTISNITIDSGDNLISTLNGGEISNLFIENYRKVNKSSNGGIVGSATNAAFIDNVHVNNITVTATTSIGGLVGSASNTTITNSSVTNVQMGDLENVILARIGGLVGYSSNSTISNSFTQDIDLEIYDAEAIYGVGGLVGIFESGYISSCYTDGSIKTNAQEVGGIVGRNNSGYINSVYSAVNIYTEQDFAGGIAGFSNNDHISNTLVIGSVYSSKQSINVDRTIGNRSASNSNYVWQYQNINGEVNNITDGETLLSTEELNNSLIYTSVIQLGSEFDYATIGNNTLPKLLDSTTDELLPNQHDVTFNYDEFRVNDVNISSTIENAIVQVEINNPNNLEIESIEIEGLNVREIRRNITQDGITIFEVLVTPNKYYDSYLLSNIHYLDSNNNEQVKDISYKVNVQFYKSIESFEDWQGIDSSSFENYRLTTNIDFSNMVNVNTNVSFNRLEGAGTSYTLSNLTLDFTSSNNALIDTIATNISNINFENITINNSGSGNYTGVIKLLNGTMSNVQFKNITVNAPRISYVGMIARDYSISVRDISLTDIDVTGVSYIGGMMGKTRYFDITNITLNNVNIYGSSNYVGGMIGHQDWINDATNFNITADTVTVTGGGNYVGGVYGYGSGTNITATNMTVTGNSNVGGISGQVSNRNIYYNSIYDSVISGRGSNIGGVSGNNETVYYLYAENIEVYGTTTNSTNVGGLVGSGGWSINYSGIKNSTVSSLGSTTGGIKGLLSYGNISQSYVYDTTVEGRTRVGGIAGATNSVSNNINNCITNANVIATNTAAGGIIGYIPNLNTNSANNITRIYYTIVADSNITASYYVGGLIGQVQNNLYPGHFYSNVVVANVSNTLSSSPSSGMVIGNGDDYASDINNLRVYEGTTLNGTALKDMKTSFNDNIIINYNELKTQSTYTSIGISTGNFDYSGLSSNNFPRLKNATNSPFMPLPDAISTMQMSYSLLGRTRMAAIHILPDVSVYAVGVNKINVEFSKIDKDTTFTIKGITKTVDELTYTYYYDFKEDFTITLTDGINKENILIEANDVKNVVSVNGDNYYYLDQNEIITNDDLEITNASNIYDQQILLDNNNIYDINTKEETTTAFQNLTETTKESLYEFRYANQLIKTYYNYSEVNGEVIDQQLFVKDNNIEVIDSTLKNKKNQLSIDYYNGNSYIIFLGTDGKIYHLKDDINYPDNFKNRDIKAISSNITNNSSLLFVLYDDGNYTVFDYKTGKIVNEDKTYKEDIISYFRNAITTPKLIVENQDDQYIDALNLTEKIEEKAPEEILNDIDNSTGSDTNETLNNTSLYTSIYNPVRNEYMIYELPSYHSTDSTTVINEVLNDSSINDTISNNLELDNYYFQDERNRRIIISSIVIIISIIGLIMISIVILGKTIRKNNKNKSIKA